jgi:hypothetical protein
MCVSVCTYECIWQLFDLRSNACCTWIAPQHCKYKHQDTRTYMYRQACRNSGWISEKVAAHTLAHEDMRSTLAHPWATVELRWAHACASMRSFLFFRWKHILLYASVMCMHVSVFCLSTIMSMHDSCQRTRARTCRDHSHTLESCGEDNHTHKHAYLCVCMCVCICIYISLLCWVYTTAVCLTLCFSSIQATLFEQQPVFGPDIRHFCQSYIA